MELPVDGRPAPIFVPEWDDGRMKEELCNWSLLKRISVTLANLTVDHGERPYTTAADYGINSMRNGYYQLSV
jgi:hypothetical protein